MTGRKGRVVQTEDGQILYESRSEADVPLETLNLTEKQRFMDGEKDVAIISEAASSGISLQSDRRYTGCCTDPQGGPALMFVDETLRKRKLDKKDSLLHIGLSQRSWLKSARGLPHSTTIHLYISRDEGILLYICLAKLKHIMFVFVTEQEIKGEEFT